MRIVYPLLGFWLGLSCLALAAPTGKKDKPKEEGPPPGTVGNIIIRAKDLSENLQMLEVPKYDIVVRYILPKGWKLEEQGKDPKTGKVREDTGIYVVTSRRPMPDPKEATDFVFELDMFEAKISAGIPKDTPQGEAYEAAFLDQFRGFLNTQVTMNLKLGNKMLTRSKDIGPKEYGPDSRGKKTVFWPIFYEVPPPPGDKSGSKGAILYTFTSFEGDTVYQLKFLVSKDMVEQHNGLIAIILDNTWAVTAEADKKLRELAKQAEAEAKSKSKGKNN